MRQEESKLRTLQNCLQQEKQLMAEQLQRERAQLEKSKVRRNSLLIIE